MSTPEEEQPSVSRRPRPIDEVIVLHRQGRLLLDDSLDPDDPILQPRRRPRRRPPTVYVHREPIPHQPTLSLSLTAMAVLAYVAWVWAELLEGATAFPLELAHGRRNCVPVVGLTSAAFAVSAFLTASIGRRPGRSRPLRLLATGCAATAVTVVVATLAVASRPLAPS